MSRIAVVSNRLPVLDQESKAAGGLAVSLRSALEESGGTWLGWDGTTTSKPDETAQTRQAEPFAVVSLALSEVEHAGYYLGFSNRTLWPLLHGRTDLVRFDPSEFATYRDVNARFAKHLAARARDHNVIWVHDYHFFLLGRELRRLGLGVPIGFFLHVPFPSPDVLLTLPCHREIVEALSAFDLVGFQTENDRRNFHELVMEHLGGAVSGDGSVFAFGRRFKTGVFPIGIDTQAFAQLAVSKEAGAVQERLKGCFREHPGVIAVDRLDYTKGISHRLRAFEQVLKTAARNETKPFLLQIAAPSREAIPEYDDLKGKLERLSGQINAQHAGIEWTPVRYINRTFSHTRLAALYRLSRVGLVTPLRDGMNLVAKEYVAAQSAADPGVLVLSRFAGAAERMTGAVLVNPYDIDGMAKAIRQALAMSLEERRERWSEMIIQLRDYDVHAWRAAFLGTLLGLSKRHGTTTRAGDVTEAPMKADAGTEGQRFTAHTSKLAAAYGIERPTRMRGQPSSTAAPHPSR